MRSGNICTISSISNYLMEMKSANIVVNSVGFIGGLVGGGIISRYVTGFTSNCEYFLTHAAAYNCTFEFANHADKLTNHLVSYFDDYCSVMPCFNRSNLINDYESTSGQGWTMALVLGGGLLGGYLMHKVNKYLIASEPRTVLDVPRPPLVPWWNNPNEQEEAKPAVSLEIKEEKASPPIAANRSTLFSSGEGRAMNYLELANNDNDAPEPSCLTRVYRRICG